MAPDTAALQCPRCLDWLDDEDFPPGSTVCVMCAKASRRLSMSPDATRLRLLDLCCCAGLAAKGYTDAGFTVTGFDIEPQPNYPYEFHQGDVLDLDPQWIADNFDAAHTSPPCQGYSGMANCRPGLAATYPKLIAPIRGLLEATGLPYVIENVEAARPEMRDPVTLCGVMFGRELYRHRLFEASFPLTQPEHPAHTIPASKAGHWRPGTVMSVAGHVAPMWKAREVMEADWTNREELVEGIPPYFAEYVGAALMAHLTDNSEAAA